MKGAMVNIGPSPESIEAARDAITTILNNTIAEEETKRHALTTLQELCNVSHTTISGCHFSQGADE